MSFSHFIILLNVFLNVFLLSCLGRWSYSTLNPLQVYQGHMPFRRSLHFPISCRFFLWLSVSKSVLSSVSNSSCSCCCSQCRQIFPKCCGFRGFFGGGRDSVQQKTLEDIAKSIREREYKRIVVMAGAGISTPSGIPDFR